MDDELVFIDEAPDFGAMAESGPRWRVLVVDDEPMVHEVTEIALEDFVFAGRGLEFVRCLSAAEAANALAAADDFAVILLDVVMETDTAGLDLVRLIRGPLGNRSVRIVLRTGQPGWVSDEEVIRDYDINDYRHKTELTAKVLAATMTFALRGYRDIQLHRQPAQTADR